MTTFEQARATVEAALRAVWAPEDGTLVVSPDGWEDESSWRVEAGAREYLVDGDLDFQRLDAPAYLVEKATGALTPVSVVENFERLGAMTPVPAP